MHVFLITPKLADSDDLVRLGLVSRLSIANAAYSRGGLGLHVARLAKALSDFGARVTVLAYSPGENSILREGSITICRISLASGGDIPDLADPSQLADLIRTGRARLTELFPESGDRPDMIHCHHHTTRPFAEIAKQMFEVPIVTTFHYLLSDMSSVEADDASEASIEGERRIVEISDRLIAVSHWLGACIVRTFGDVRPPIDVIHHGTELPHLDAEPGSSPVAKRLLCFKDRPVITYVGRLSAEKGFDVFLDAAKIVAQSSPDASFLVAGGRPEEIRELELETAREAVLKNRIIFLGWLNSSDLGELRRVSSIAMVPSLYESFGYTALEAMAFGIPVVASAVGGLPEIIQDGRCGYLIAPAVVGVATRFDPGMFASRLLELLQVPPLRQLFSAVARRRVQDHFTVDQMVAKTMGVYQQTIEGFGKQ